MLSSAVVHTTSSAAPVPQTMLSLKAVPHTMLSQSPPHVVPHTMLSPLSAFAAPHVVPSPHALTFGSSTPPVSRRLPHAIALLHRLWTGYGSPGCAVVKNF